MPVTYVSAVYAAAAMENVLMASPSRPSVRFTAFDTATSTNTANGRYQIPSSGISRLKNGKINRVL